MAEYRAAGLDEVVLAGLHDPEETRRAVGAIQMLARDETAEERSPHERR
jgi:hypothetical protein